MSSEQKAPSPAPGFRAQKSACVCGCNLSPALDTRRGGLRVGPRWASLDVKLSGEHRPLHTRTAAKEKQAAVFAPLVFPQRLWCK